MHAGKRRRTVVNALLLLMVLSGVFSAPVSAADPQRSLFITSLAVVEDPARTYNPCSGAGTPLGSWTFGHLMTNIANPAETGIDPSHFAREWLELWLTAQTVNQELLPARAEMQELILGPWEEASGGPGSPLDLSKAPFRLLAIVNRVDLRGNRIIGSGGAGEARFVFGAVDLANNCEPLEFTVAFEYLMQGNTCESHQQWGRWWSNLERHRLGSPTYNANLERLTNRFVSAGARPAQRPNKSALSHLRTNEGEFSAEWEMREFQLASRGEQAGYLAPETLQQTPVTPLNGTSTLADYVNENEQAILLGNNVVPLQYPVGSPFLAGLATYSNLTFWNGPDIRSAEARHLFALQSCSGCHARETNTNFTHIGPTRFGTQAELSGYLTGINVLDPGDNTTVRPFNEFSRRVEDLDQLLATSCP